MNVPEWVVPAILVVGFLAVILETGNLARLLIRLGNVTAASSESLREELQAIRNDVSQTAYQFEKLRKRLAPEDWERENF